MSLLKTLAIIFTLAFYFNIQFSFGDTTQNRYLGIELGGAAGLGSVNYQHSIYASNSLEAFVKTGLSTFQIIDFRRKFNPDIIIPVGLHLLVGKKHKLELGFGTVFNSQVILKTPQLEVSRNTFMNLYGNFGYRYEQPQKRWFANASYTPIHINSIGFRNWAVLGFGLKLNK